MKQPQNGFDAKNSPWYMVAISALLVGELVTVIAILMGSPPDFVKERSVALVAFAIAASCTFVFLMLLKRTPLRPIYWLCLSMIVFSIAGLVSGYNWGVCVIACASGVVVMAIAHIAGEQGDKNSPVRTIRLKLPWK